MSFHSIKKLLWTTIDLAEFPQRMRESIFHDLILFSSHKFVAEWVTRELEATKSMETVDRNDRNETRWKKIE